MALLSPVITNLTENSKGDDGNCRTTTETFLGADDEKSEMRVLLPLQSCIFQEEDELLPPGATLDVTIELAEVF